MIDPARIPHLVAAQTPFMWRGWTAFVSGHGVYSVSCSGAMYGFPLLLEQGGVWYWREPDPPAEYRRGEEVNQLKWRHIISAIKPNMHPTPSNTLFMRAVHTIGLPAYMAHCIEKGLPL